MIALGSLHPVLAALDGHWETIGRTVVALVGALGTATLSPRRDPPIEGVRRFLAATIVAVGAVIWALESRPSWIMTFVVSGGLGFSGYSLIELAGRETMASVKALFRSITSIFRRNGRA